MAAESVAAQRAAEAGDTLSFEEYRQQYLSQPLVETCRFETARPADRLTGLGEAAA